MRSDPQRLLRGFGKLVAVVLAAGLAGAGIGIALAKLTGSGDSSTPALPAAAGSSAARASTARGSATTTQAIARQEPTASTRASNAAGARTTTAAKAPASSPSSLGPRVQVLSAQLDGSSTGTGHVAVRVRVINRATRPLAVEAPVLLSGTDEIQRDSDGGSAVRPLLRKLAAGSSATSVLRFTTTSVVTKRLSTTRRAQLRIAQHNIRLKLTATNSSPSG